MKASRVSLRVAPKVDGELCPTNGPAAGAVGWNLPTAGRSNRPDPHGHLLHAEQPVETDPRFHSGCVRWNTLWNVDIE